MIGWQDRRDPALRDCGAPAEFCHTGGSQYPVFFSVLPEQSRGVICRRQIPQQAVGHQIAGMAFTKKDEVHGVSQAPYLSAAMRINFIKTS